MLRLGFCPINTILVKLDGLTSLKRQGVEPRCSGMGPVSPAPAGVSVPSPLGQPGLGVVRHEGIPLDIYQVTYKMIKSIKGWLRGNRYPTSCPTKHSTISIFLKSRLTL